MSDAIQLVAKENVGVLVVMEDDRPVGIFTEQHYARDVFPMGNSSPKARTREIMTTDVICARPEQTVEEYMALMIEIGSERGKALLDHLPRWDATPANLQTAHDLSARTATSKGPQMPAADVRDLMLCNLEHPAGTRSPSAACALTIAPWSAPLILYAGG